MHASRSHSSSVFSVCGIKDLRVLQANVCTVHLREMVKSSTKQACGSTARMITLDTMFADADAHVVCVQEGRIQEDGQHSCANFKMFRAGATSRGTDGSQIWVQHDLARAVTAVKVLSPRLLRVVVQDGSTRLEVLSGHAPFEAAPSDEKNKFWTQLASEIESVGHSPLDLIICGIDGNARVGSIASEFVGTAERDDESENGSALRMMADETKLHVVNSFHSAGPTWCSSRGSTSRIDYVLAQSDLAASAKDCMTRPDVDIATKIRDDHYVLEVVFRGISDIVDARASSSPQEHACARARKLRPAKYTVQSMQDPACIQYFREQMSSLLRTVGCAPASTPQQVEMKAKFIVEILHSAALASFTPSVNVPRKPWISEGTWSVIQASNHVRCSLRRLARLRRTVTLHFGFRLWLCASQVSFTVLISPRARSSFMGVCIARLTSTMYASRLPCTR